MSEQYMYLFTRRDLSHQQQIIQTSHAVHLMGMLSEKSDEIPNAVLIGIESQDHLLDIRQFLEDNQIKSEIFYEPDISEFTAIATHPIRGNDRKKLKTFKLM